jgi:hypothetical protein
MRVPSLSLDGPLLHLAHMQPADAYLPLTESAARPLMCQTKGAFGNPTHTLEKAHRPTHGMPCPVMPSMLQVGIHTPPFEGS